MDEPTSIEYNDKGAKEFIDNHKVAMLLRQDPNLIELRPDMNLRAPSQPGALTGNSYLESKAPLPTFSWVNKDGKSLKSIIYLDRSLHGHPSAVHGGIIALILDEALVRCGTNALGGLAVTASLNIAYKLPIPVNSYVLVSANVIPENERKVLGEAIIESLDEPRVLYAKGDGLFLIPKARL